MKIALLQLNARLGAPEVNGRALEAAYADALKQGAELVLAPELTICGYLPEDRFWEPGLRARMEAESLRLASLAGPVPLIFGTASPAPSGRLWNELWWAERGARRARIRKRLLPAYDVFDESRYFEADSTPQPLVDFGGERIGLSICEDLWADEAFAHNLVRYAVDPIAELKAQGATLLLNASASPGYLGSWMPTGKVTPWAVPSKIAQRRRLIQGLATKHGVPLVYGDRCGAESWLLFDGGSGLAQPDGTWQGASPFHEGLVMVDTVASGGTGAEVDEARWLRAGLVMALKDNLAKQGLEAVVVGMSGGIDSAVVAALAVDALGAEGVLGVALPTRFSSEESLRFAEEQARELGMPFLKLDADAPYAGFAASLKNAFPDRAFSLTDENLQSRARGSLLMGLSSEPAVHARLGSSKVCVLNTGNKSEAATGYFTLYGDGIGAFGLLGDCLKARVRDLAGVLPGVPEGVIARPPTAELKPGQTDEESLLPYRQLDAILAASLEAQRPEEGLAEDLALLLDGDDLAQARAALPRVLGLLRRTEFKRRQLPFAIKVSPKAFGWGRRIPLTAE
ncbi:MAG TPA: NAD(+) synthase [Holophagaceae bacterium]|jgi:NAD+ synthase (glutamine-hydrolysing)|nr:NAD(+) synthase [Holophagaceae bacterium]